MSDFFSVDDMAAMLDMHTRTIRRYIKEGQLKAAKVGGEWRIRKEDAEMFLGGKVKQLQKEAVGDVTDFLDGLGGNVDGNYQVCTVLDCYVDTEQAVRISEILMRHMNEPDPQRGKAHYQYFYNEQEKKSRYIIWGRPAFVGKMLTAVGSMAR